MKELNIWLIIVAIFFDLLSATYSYLYKRNEEKNKNKNWLKYIYKTYILLIVIGNFMYFFNTKLALYIIYLAIIVCAVYIIIKSILSNEVEVGNVEIIEDKEIKHTKEKALSNKIEDNESHQKEIVE